MRSDGEFGKIVPDSPIDSCCRRGGEDDRGGRSGKDCEIRGDNAAETEEMGSECQRGGEERKSSKRRDGQEGQEVEILWILDYLSSHFIVL